MTRNPFILNVWNAMKQRCLNPRCRIWPHYGGRGITICEEWKASNGFWAFQEWAIAAGWAEGLTLDRTNNDGNYEPGNCSFVTRAENLRNRRMTPKWRAAILAAAAIGRHTMTPKRLASCQRNMAKARSVANSMPRSQAQLDAARRNFKQGISSLPEGVPAGGMGGGANRPATPELSPPFSPKSKTVGFGFPEEDRLAELRRMGEELRAARESGGASED